MSQLMVELIGSGYGVIMVATHAFVDRTWLKWSLIAIEAISCLATGLIIAINC